VKDMQFMVNVLNKVTNVYGQAISIKKTEIMRVKTEERGLVRDGPANRHRVPITIDGQDLKEIAEFKYVGGTENNEATMCSEVKIRKQRMGMAYSKYDERVFSNKYI